MLCEEIIVMRKNVYINSFFVEANKFKREGIFLDKDYIKQLDVKRKCIETSEGILGSDKELVYDVDSAKAFLRTLVSENDFKIFANALTMGLTYSIERLLLLYDKLNNRGDECTQQVLGVIYFLVGHILEDEFKTLIKASNGGRLYPAYTLSKNAFKWSRCTNILRKYMLRLSKPNGYDAYYYERPNLCHLAFLTSDCVGMDVESAEDYISKMKQGIFLKNISSTVENKLSPDILMGGYDILDGLYASTILKETIALEDELGTNADISSVYSQHVKPLMIEFMGRIISIVNDEVSRNTELESGVFKIYHISPNRVGILVKEGVDIKDVLPTSHTLFKKVPVGITQRSLVLGEYL